MSIKKKNTKRSKKEVCAQIRVNKRFIGDILL